MKIDHERQQLVLLERDETIRILRLERDEQEQLIEKYQNQIKQIGINLEQQKSSLLNATESQDQFNDFMNQKLQENLQLENELKVCQSKYDEIQENFNRIIEEKHQLTEQIKNLESNQNDNENVQVKFQIFRFSLTNSMI